VEDRTFDVYQVGYSVTEFGLNLLVNYQVADLADTTALLQDMNVLKGFMTGTFPEYEEVFRTLTLRAAAKGQLRGEGFYRTWPLMKPEGEE
jgi:hypothetical protein